MESVREWWILVGPAEGFKKEELENLKPDFFMVIRPANASA